jgi:hypothetical protein
MMREAYLDFYSKSLAIIDKDNEVVPYSKRMNYESKEHSRIIGRLFDKDIAPPEMKVDPLLSKESDI